MSDESNEPEWLRISCETREALVNRNGERYGGLGVASSLTDLSGEYGEAQVFTEWYDRATGESVLRDYRWPDPRAVDQPFSEPRLPDVKPCEHFEAVYATTRPDVGSVARVGASDRAAGER